MTTHVECVESILETWDAAWDAAACPYYADSEQGDPAGTNPTSTPWARILVREERSAQETLGGVGARTFERSGTVIVQIFTPLSTGTASGAALAIAARTILEGKSLSSGVWLFSGPVESLGSDGSYWQHQLRIPFRYYERK